LRAASHFFGVLRPAGAQQGDPGCGIYPSRACRGRRRGKSLILIDGEDIFPKGYDLGQRTGGFGLKAGAHTISIKKTGVETGTTKMEPENRREHSP
jgi:hypothetical protein